MDLQCPAVVVCLPPDADAPETAGGYRVVRAYTFGQVALTGAGAPDPRPAPEGKFWQVITKIADLHRGEAVVLYADVHELDSRDLIGVAMSVDSAGPMRIRVDQPVDNGY